MKTLICSIFTVLLVIDFSCFAQEVFNVEVHLTDALKEKNEVPFSASKLTWDDFKGEPDRSSPWVAMTFSGIKLKYDYSGRNHVYNARVFIYPYMDPSTSWYKEKGHDDYTLAHEQLHFDITILMAKKMAIAIKKHKAYNAKNYAKTINRIHEEYLKKLKLMQNHYDEETRHGINRQKQSQWSLKIKQELKDIEQAFNP